MKNFTPTSNITEQKMTNFKHFISHIAYYNLKPGGLAGSAAKNNFLI